MKILHVSQFAWPFVGGLEKLVGILSDHQSKTHEVEILALTHPLQCRPFSENKNKVRITRFPSRKIIKNAFLLPQFGFCKCVAKTNSDILFTHTRLFPTSFLAGWIFKKKFPHRKWIHIEHGQNFVVHHNKFIQILARAWDEIFGRWIFSHADKVVVVSEKGKTFTQDLGAKNITVIPTGIRISAHQKSIPRKNKALFFGRMVREKGIKELLFAAKQNPQWHFEFVGDGPPFRFQELSNVLWTPAVDEEKLFEKIQNADLVILPSWSESLSLALLEASSLARTIVATDVGENQNILSSEFIIPARNAVILSQKIQSLAGQFDLLSQEGAKNQEKVRKNYSFDTMTEQYDALLK